MKHFQNLSQIQPGSSKKYFLRRLIIGSDRRSETKEGKIDRCRSCVRSRIWTKRILCAGQAIAIIAVANLCPPADPNGCINLLPKCKLYLGVTFRSPLISFKMSFKGRFLCRLGFRVGFLYHLGFRIRVSIAETSAVNPLSLSYRTGFTAERRLYLLSGEIIKCARVRNLISPAF